MYAQNNPSAPFYLGSGVEPCYYADADGVVRRATGAYVPSVNGSSASAAVGLPTASINGYTNAPQSTPAATATTPATKTPFTQSQSRPLLLHRPFRTVAELGYVFRDVPWKNIDFFTPESGDAALLDLFCINETGDPNGMVAGKVNLNTRQAPVLTAIVSGGYVDVHGCRQRFDSAHCRHGHSESWSSSKRLRACRQMERGSRRFRKCLWDYLFAD
jgi:hypothetical protein